MLDGFKHSDCLHLAREVMLVNARVVGFRHIHIGYGAEDRVLDSATEAYDEIMMNENLEIWGCLAIVQMMFDMLMASLYRKIYTGRAQVTTFVNAAIVRVYENHVINNNAIVGRI